jgi:hypothetical protein
MCQRITCRECGKPSFAGCGRHVESVLGDVPPSERCHGHAVKDETPPSAGSPSTGLQRFFAFLSCGSERR